MNPIPYPNTGIELLKEYILKAEMASRHWKQKIKDFGNDKEFDKYWTIEKMNHAIIKMENAASEFKKSLEILEKHAKNENKL